MLHDASAESLRSDAEAAPSRDTRKIRVGHLIKGLGRGGAETLLPHLARATAGYQDTHVAYFLTWKGTLADDLVEAGADVTCLGVDTTVRVLAAAGAASRWIRDHGLDLVHCHLPVSGATGRRAGRRAGVPVVYTEHNLQERYRWPTRLLNRATWSLQDHVIAVSAEVARSIGRALPGSVPVTVVPNGIPELPFREPEEPAGGFRRSVGLAGAPVVGTIAVFRTQKRLDLWIDVARSVHERIPDARFALVGDGPLRGEVDAAVREAGLDQVVVRPGLQSNVADWLGCMDVFLMTSEFEGLPLALLEAMMAGVPVVATTVGGVPEVIRDEREGYLLPFGAVDRQADRVVELLRSPARRAELARSARRVAIDRYGIDRMAARIDRIYRDVLDRRER